jgi:hypothetical protein
MQSSMSLSLRLNCLLAVCLGLPLQGCSKEQPHQVAASQTNPNSGPRITIKGSDDVTFNGQKIVVRRTSAEEARKITGHDPSDQMSADSLWHRDGVVIHAAQDSSAPNTPDRVHRVAVWFGREKTTSRTQRSCTPEEEKQHLDSVRFRLESMSEFERRNNFPRDEDGRLQVLNERCSRFTSQPVNTFRGTLEVDGMSVLPNMTLRQIQQERERLGLLPLRMLSVSGPLVYVAPRDRHQPWRNQLWEFSVEQDQKLTPDTLRIKLISVP